MANEDIFHLGIKALIKNDQNKYLLLQTNPEKLNNHKGEPYWDIPGGRIEKGSTVIETLKREILEETGITETTNHNPLVMTLSTIRIPIGDSDVGLILSVYECTADNTDNIKLSDEHIDFGWFEKEKVAELLSFKYQKDFCKLIASH